MGLVEFLPDLGALAAWAFLLLIAAALWVLIALLRNTFSGVPVIGPWIVTNIGNALNDARNAVLSAASASWRAGVQMFNWLGSLITSTDVGMVNTLVSLWQFGGRILHVTLPNLENRIFAWSISAISSVQTFASNLFNTAETDAAILVSRAETVVVADVNAAVADAVRLFDTATAAIANGIVTAEADAASLVTNASAALRADIAAAEALAAGEINGLAASTQAAINSLGRELTAGVAGAEALAAANLGAAVGGIYTDLETWGKQAVADAWPDVQGDIGALKGVLGQDFPWLNDLLGALGGVGAAGLLGALIQSMAGAHAITKLAADCVVPQCRNLGGLSSDLGNLLSAGSTAAMLAWLIFAVTDPAGWAAETAALGGPVAATAARDATRLFGGG